MWSHIIHWCLGVYIWKSEDVGYWGWCGRWFGLGRPASDHGLDTHISDVVVENTVCISECSWVWGSMGDCRWVQVSTGKYQKGLWHLSLMCNCWEMGECCCCIDMCECRWGHQWFIMSAFWWWATAGKHMQVSVLVDVMSLCWGRLTMTFLYYNIQLFKWMTWFYLWFLYISVFLKPISCWQYTHMPVGNVQELMLLHRCSSEGDDFICYIWFLLKPIIY